MSGMEDMCVAGGTEMMSLYGSEGFKGSPFLDNGNTRLRAEHPQPHQGVCADAIATLEGIDREAVDDLAYVSQQRAKNAIENGHFDKALVPVHREDGSLALDKEEFPRPQTTRDDLRALDPLSPNSQIFRWMKKARPSASWSIRPIRIWRSITSTTPATRLASWTVPPHCF